MQASRSVHFPVPQGYGLQNWNWWFVGFRMTLCLLCAIVFSPCRRAFAQDSFDLAPIFYSASESQDPVAQLQRRLQAGQTVLDKDPEHGLLPSLLKELRIPLESQVLVFSKTSLQIHKISPTNPRAIYFNDSVYVGYVPGSTILELAANDPKLGAVFYTFDTAIQSDTTQTNGSSANGPSSNEASSNEASSGLVRDRGQCLSCHATTRTENVPGYLVRSIYSDRAGRPRTGSSSFTTDYRSPFQSRWGGWYVTGTHGSMRHLGNLFAVDRTDPQKVDFESGANQLQLPSRVAPGLHPQPHSDLVALMVLEHQIRVHNLITKANFETRQAIAMDESMNKALGRDPQYRSESTERRIQSVANHLADALLMHGEPPLEGAVSGTSNFAAVFPSTGPRDQQGRSLRDLDLKTRLFRFPLSYLIYTQEFQQLPSDVMKLIRAKLATELDLPERQAEREILNETLPGFLTGKP
jgi:hypothetical protein